MSLLTLLRAALLMLIAPCAAAEPPPGPTIAARIGAGNLVTHEAGSGLQANFDTLRAVGARLGRMNSYGWRHADGRPNPADFDAAMLQARREGITPVLLLEYYADYARLDPPQPVGDAAQWFAVGRALAERFRPNGSWGREHGVADWGVTVFAAFNEPDVQARIPPEQYRAALAALADGIHAVDPGLRVVPGGFASCNSHGDATLRGYATAIAGLLNDGRLDGIDLHTYYHARWYPLLRGREFSVQRCFDAIKRAAGITRDIHFYATEFNVTKVTEDDQPMPEPEAARQFLTALWDNLGVTGADGRPATVLAFPYSLFETPQEGEAVYAMTQSRRPWQGDARGEVLRRVLRLAGDMHITRIDQVRGMLWLRAGQRQLVVWHNRQGWTDQPGAPLVLDLPPGARQVSLHGDDGLRRQIPLNGQDRITLGGLATGETHMVLVE